MQTKFTIIRNDIPIGDFLGEYLQNSHHITCDSPADIRRDDLLTDGKKKYKATNITYTKTKSADSFFYETESLLIDVTPVE